MPTAKLTDRFLKTLKAGERRVEYWDQESPSLGLRVGTSGTRTFMFRYRTFDGKRRRMTLGQYPGLTLANARIKARHARLAVDEKRDPVREVKQEQRAASAARAKSFGVLAEDYIERHAKRKKKESSWREDLRYLNADVLPAWDTVPVAELDRWSVIELLEPKAKTSPIAANRLRALLSTIFGFGIRHGYLEVNPVQYVDKPGKEKQRERVLNESEIRAVWEACETELPVTAATFRLRLLTAQRSEEIRSMRWADLEGSWWTLPAERTKNGLSHRVPLSPLAMSLIEELRPLTGSSEWVFESPRKPGEYLGRFQTAARRIRERSSVDDWTPHDLRRTAASHMASLGVSQFLLARILNHADKSVTAVYNRHTYDEEKRRALELWADRLGGIVSGSGLARVLAIHR